MTDQPTQAVAVRQPTSVQNIQPMLDTAKFEHFQRASKALMFSSILNGSIRGNSPEQCFSNLMLIFDLSDRWKLPAISIAQGVAIVHDKVVYEGKLITAMLDASLGVRLQYWWQGDRGTPGYRIYISDRPFSELTSPTKDPADQIAEINKSLTPGVQIPGWRLVDGSVEEWRTFQKDGRSPNPAWTGAATQNQLSYRGSREWARRFEPAQMLGVYGDDEIDTLTIQMQARDVTPARAPGLSGGFTAPIEAIETDPDVRSMDDIAPQEAQEGQKAALDPKGQEEIKAPAGEPETGKEAQKEGKAGRTPKQQKVVDDRKAALEKAQQMGEAAHDSALWGYDGELLDLMGGQEKWDALTPEEQSYCENGWNRGKAQQSNELEAAYNAGALGVKMEKPDWLQKGDKSGERRAALLTAEWKRGQTERDAEKVDDQTAAQADMDEVEGDFEGDDGEVETTGNEMLDAIREVEPELVDQVLEDHGDDDDDDDGGETLGADAIDMLIASLPGLSDWKALKAALNAVAKSDAWANADPARQASVRAAIWLREADIVAAGDERMDFITDGTAFRCWLDSTDDVDAIHGNWRVLVHQPVFTGMPEGQRKALEKATLDRVAALEAKG